MSDLIPVVPRSQEGGAGEQAAVGLFGDDGTCNCPLPAIHHFIQCHRHQKSQGRSDAACIEGGDSPYNRAPSAARGGASDG